MSSGQAGGSRCVVDVVCKGVGAVGTISPPSPDSAGYAVLATRARGNARLEQVVLVQGAAPVALPSRSIVHQGGADREHTASLAVVYAVNESSHRLLSRSYAIQCYTDDTVGVLARLTLGPKADWRGLRWRQDSGRWPRGRP